MLKGQTEGEEMFLIQNKQTIRLAIFNTFF
jgi:hypothetical protein